MYECIQVAGAAAAAAAAAGSMYLPSGAIAGATGGAPYTLRLINPPLAEQPLTLGMRVLKVTNLDISHTIPDHKVITWLNGS
jgi:hypothetical protein